MDDKWVAIVIAVIAVAFTGIQLHLNMLDRTRANTFDVWKVWISRDYRAYRVLTSRLIKQARREAGDQKVILKDLFAKKDAEEAIGSIEHFLVEVSKIKDANLLENNLFRALFRDSIVIWKDLLSDFDRSRTDAFPESEMNDAFEVLIGASKNYRIESSQQIKGANLEGRGHMQD